MTLPDRLHPQLCPCLRCRHPGPGQRKGRADRVVIAAGAGLLILILLFALKGS